MGRKPNQLILEFFERGAKLEDASNRYQHTCRSCGEKFPKGRIDSLTVHLLKKCPVIAPDDRQRVVQQLSEIPNQHGSVNQIALSMRRAHAHGPLEYQLPFVADQNMSALETLAEVSRQRLDSNGQYVLIVNTGNLKKRRRSSSEALEQHIQSGETLVQDDQALHQGLQDLDNEMIEDAQQDAATSLNYYTAEQQSPLMSRALLNPGDMASVTSTAQMLSSQLAQAASAANAMLPNHVALPPESEMSKLKGLDKSRPDLEPYNVPSSITAHTIDPQLRDDVDQEQKQLRGETPGQVGSHLRTSSSNLDLPHASYLNDFSISPNGVQRPKVRGRFSATRRKEVQEVRKQGACVRCRMLKKPCSGGTPCTTCNSVESARLWKQPCVRTRIADEFDLYSSQLHTVMSFHEISHVKKQMSLTSSPNQVGANHFHDSQNPCAVFASIQGRIPVTPGSNVHALAHDAFGGKPEIDIELLDQETDDIGRELEHYIRNSAQAFFENETSSVMRPTLLLALDLAHQKLDSLLNRALDLWTATHILTDPAASWDFFSIPPRSGDLSDTHFQRLSISQTSQPTNHHLLTLQVRGHVERRAAVMAKSVMNELERRLLQRQQTSGQQFETFIIAIILLNCAEKMCWLFHTWVAQSGTGSLCQRRDWPLDRPPEEFVAKGERLADVVTMLLRMRGVPPRTVVDESGILRADLSSGRSPSTVKSSKTGSGEMPESNSGRIAPSEQNPVAATWLDSIAIRPEDLKLTQAEYVAKWDATDCRCWELRYISRLLITDE